MHFSDQFLDEVVARNDIADVVSSYVTLTRKGGNLFGLCPFHNEKTPSFSVAPDKQIYHCFGCKKGGGVINFIMDIEGLSFTEAVQFLAKRANMPLPEEDEGASSADKLRRRVLELNRTAARWYYDQLQGPQGQPVQAYLDKRQIHRGIAVRFGMGASLDQWDALLRAMTAQGFTKEELLAATTLALQQQQEELDQNRTALTSAQDSLALQQSKIEEQAALLAAQQAQIDKLVGLRSQIIEDLRDNLSDVGQRVTVDRKTGAVTFESSVLFDTGRNEIKEAGKAALNSCIPVYIHTLLSEEYRDYVGEIIVEGHTDTTGQYLNNLALSQQRALAVATYCLSDEMVGLSYTDKETFKSIMTANGRADADPIYNADGTVNMDASRRVVIKFRMKDSDMIDQMSAILEGSAQGD